MRTSPIEEIKFAAKSALDAGRTADAWSILMQHKDLLPSDQDLLSLLAVTVIQQERYAEAKAFLIDALSAFPQSTDLLFNLAYVCEKQKEYALAQKLYKICRASATENAADIDGAIESMEWALRRNPSRRKKLSFVYQSHSGSNTIALYKLTPDSFREKYEIQLIQLSLGLEYQLKILDSDLVVTTHGDNSLDPDQLVFDLWHGFPLKAMGLMDKQENHEMIRQVRMRNTDRIASVSMMFTTLMNACIGKTVDKYVTTGWPRNDLLFSCDGADLLARIIKRDIAGKKIVMYMPTFRARSSNATDGNQPWGNFDMLGLADEEFSRFVEGQDILFVLKLHPFEERFVLSRLEGRELRNFVFLRDEELAAHHVDLYEVLSAVDLLVTDYSSVYFDFLLLDKPILFAPVDYEEYRETRGFLLEPYDRWTPGPKVRNRGELQHELIRALEDPGYYQAERKHTADIVHQYQDGRSTERVWRVIEEMLG